MGPMGPLGTDVGPMGQNSNIKILEDVVRKGQKCPFRKRPQKEKKEEKKMAIKFVLNETSYFGENARESLVEEIQKRNFKKVFLVSDKALVGAGVTAKVEKILNDLFSNPDKMQEMKVRARLMAKKNSTKDICKILLG